MNNQAYRNSPSQSASAGLSHSTCWYCNHHVPSENRFCDRSCAEAFDDDEVAAERRMLAKQQDKSLMFS